MWYGVCVGNGADTHTESEMAEDKDAAAKMEALNKDAAAKLEALRQRAAYGLGFDHGMLVRMGRRCSVRAQTIIDWFPEDLQAYQLAFTREGR